VLLEALKEYNGTVVFVSHDRYFIDNLATRVFEIQEGYVHVYTGNYEDYLWRKAGGPEAMVAEAVVAAPVDEAPAAVVKKDKPRVNPMKAQKMRERLSEVELEVASLESAIQQVEAALGDFKSAEETARLSKQLDVHRGELEQRVAEWEELTAELDEQK
jgi:ATP-binding cassette subfamily F protein 3